MSEWKSLYSQNSQFLTGNNTRKTREKFRFLSAAGLIPHLHKEGKKKKTNKKPKPKQIVKIKLAKTAKESKANKS